MGCQELTKFPKPSTEEETMAGSQNCLVSVRESWGWNGRWVVTVVPLTALERGPPELLGPPARRAEPFAGFQT